MCKKIPEFEITMCLICILSNYLYSVIAHDLSHLDIDVAALSQVHYADKGSLQELCTCFILFSSRKPSTDGCLSGVGSW